MTESATDFSQVCRVPIVQSLDPFRITMATNIIGDVSTVTNIV